MSKHFTSSRGFKIFLAAWAFVENCLFGGLRAGWAALVYVLKKEHIYGHLCVPYTPVTTATPHQQPANQEAAAGAAAVVVGHSLVTTNQNDGVRDAAISAANQRFNYTTAHPYPTNHANANASAGVALHLEHISSLYDLIQDWLVKLHLPGDTADIADAGEGEFWNTTEVKLYTLNASNDLLDCSEQDTMFNACFTVATATMALSALFFGHLNYKFGIRVPRVLSVLFFVAGCASFATVNTDLPWLIFPGLLLVSSGGMALFLTNNQISYMFSTGGAAVVGLLCGALEASSFTQTLMKIAHDESISLRVSYLFLGGLNLLTLVSTFCFLPKHFVYAPDKTTVDAVEVDACNSDVNNHNRDDAMRHEAVTKTDMLAVVVVENGDSVRRTSHDVSRASNPRKTSPLLEAGLENAKNEILTPESTQRTRSLLSQTQSPDWSSDPCTDVKIENRRLSQTKHPPTSDGNTKSEDRYTVQNQNSYGTTPGGELIESRSAVSNKYKDCPGSAACGEPVDDEDISNRCSISNSNLPGYKTSGAEMPSIIKDNICDTADGEGQGQVRDSIAFTGRVQLAGGSQLHDKKPLTLARCLLSRNFLLYLMWATVVQIILSLCLGTFNPWLIHILGDKESTKVSEYTDVLLYSMLASPLLALAIGLGIDALRKSKSLDPRVVKSRVMFTAVISLGITSIFGILTCACSMALLSDVIVLTCISVVIFRTTLYSCGTAFLRIMYPTEYFGLLSGITSVLVGGFGFLQYPLFMWVQARTNGWREVYGLLGILGVISLGQPAFLYWKGKQLLKS